MHFDVDFYEKLNGTRPAQEFIMTLEPAMRAKTLWVIQMLEQNGNALREPYTKSIGNGIFEVRAKVGSDITRVLYFFVVGQKIILTNGFVKKTQKTPKNQIALAEKYRDDYMSRYTPNKGGKNGNL